MTEKQPAVWMDGTTFTSEDNRRMLAALTADRSGIVGPGDFAVTAQATPNMTVNVAGGRAFVRGTQSSFQGTYFLENRGNEIVTLLPANATLPRRSLIVARVYDADYGGTLRTWAIEEVAGTAAGTPFDPPAPANSFVFASVRVPANASSIIASDITDYRLLSGRGRATTMGGLITVTAEINLPADAPEGTQGYVTSTGIYFDKMAASWVPRRGQRIGGAFIGANTPTALAHDVGAPVSFVMPNCGGTARAVRIEAMIRNLINGTLPTLHDIVDLQLCKPDNTILGRTSVIAHGNGSFNNYQPGAFFVAEFRNDQFAAGSTATVKLRMSNPTGQLGVDGASVLWATIV